MIEKIAVTGCTGTVGGEVVKLLNAKQLPARLLVRNVQTASYLKSEFFEIQKLDFDDSNTYEMMLENIDRLLLILTPGTAHNADEFLEKVKKSGVKQIIFISGIGADQSKRHFLRDVEKEIEALCIPYIFLRANWFMQNFAKGFENDIKIKQELSFPDGKAKISFIDARDLAEVAFYFLTNPIVKSVSYDITGPESLTHAELAKLFSQSLAYDVSYRELSEEEARKEKDWGDIWLDLFRDIREGLSSPVSRSVEEILYKRARNFHDYIKEHKNVWKKQT